jgi:hypothetical protein
MVGSLALAAVSSAGADSLEPVRVALPLGLHADIPETSAGAAGMKYVTLGSLAIVNPSRYSPQGFQPSQFHLLAGDKVYYPAVRSGLEALDLSEGAVLAPGAGIQVTVSFLVPNAVTAAKFEFMPHWMADDGHTVDYCCYYL